MTYKKNINYLPVPDINEIKIVSEHFKINKYISAILIQRQGFDINKISNFLNNENEKLLDPFLMEGMTEAIKLISNSINNSENILIYGDYDVDGITGISILFTFLQNNYNLGGKLNYKTASRFDTGYGLSIETVNTAIKNNINLIITVDCGTKDYEPIKLCRNNNIKVIVIDHHEFGEEVNSANIILNPKNPKCKYPFKELTGCGVVFKFIQGFSKYYSLNNDINNFLDMVSLSICCDIVPLVDENRILLVKGLEKINKNPNLGLKYLLNKLGLKKIEVKDILFKIGPRINAAGRINDSKICVDLFVSSNENKIKDIFNQIEEYYLIRKKLCSEAIKEIDLKIDKFNDSKPVIFYNKNWNLGILGILASKCVEKKYVPSIIMSNKDNDYIVGSIRSIGDINSVDLLNCCKNFLVKYGGHKMAAGFLLKESNLNSFVDVISEKIEKTLHIKHIERKINVEIRLPLKEINDNFYNDLTKLYPFGIGNEEPIFESIIKVAEYYFSFSDTICKIINKSGYELIGIIKNINIPLTGIYKIQYKVNYNNSIFLNIENFEKIN